MALESQPPNRRWLATFMLARALGATVLGILLLIRPNDTVRTLAQITGILLLVIGTVDIVASLVQAAVTQIRFLVLGRGILTIGIAVALLALTEASVAVITILLGMQLVVGGGISLVLSVRLREQVEGWQVAALRGVLALGIGVTALALPDRSVATLGLLFGVQWILSGVASTVVAVRVASDPTAG